MKPEILLQKAKQAQALAYAPYSGYQVGAALLCADGTIYTGCNIENAAYSPTNCAERTAIFKAVSEGQREFVALAVCAGMGGKTENGCTPCGVCRQVLSEFCKPDMPIYLANPDGFDTVTLSQLLPHSFKL